MAAGAALRVGDRTAITAEGKRVGEGATGRGQPALSPPEPPRQRLAPRLMPRARDPECREGWAQARRLPVGHPAGGARPALPPQTASPHLSSGRLQGRAGGPWAHLLCRSRRRRLGGPACYSGAGSTPSSSRRRAGGRAGGTCRRAQKSRARGGTREGEEEGRHRNKRGGRRPGRRAGSVARCPLPGRGLSPAWGARAGVGVLSGCSGGEGSRKR